METKTHILDELKLLSPLIAGLDKVNIFTVPGGYFDSVSATVLTCLQDDDPFFNIPEHHMSPAVPEGYFNQLADNILTKIKTAETSQDELLIISPLLSGIQKKRVFEVPAGYFESVADNINGTINQNGFKEDVELSPLLHSMQGKTVFEVPVEYFDSLPGDILKKVKSPAKVVSMRKSSVLIKYAAAAMLTGVTALGIYKYLDKPYAIISVQPNVAALDASIEKGKNMNTIQFNEALGSLKEADIAQYLENNGDIADVTALRNNLDDTNLPSENDYLLDGTTLETYLKEIEKTPLNN